MNKIPFDIAHKNSTNCLMKTKPKYIPVARESIEHNALVPIHYHISPENEAQRANEAAICH